MMDVKAAAGSVVITGIAAIGRAVADTTATTGDNRDLFTSFGVFGAALAIAYFMLRRGDNRERDLADSWKSEIDAIRKELHEAQSAAQAATSKYVEAAGELAKAKGEIAALQHKVDELTAQIYRPPTSRGRATD